MRLICMYFWVLHNFVFISWLRLWSGYLTELITPANRVVLLYSVELVHSTDRYEQLCLVFASPDVVP